MIVLSKEKYVLDGIKKEVLWNELDKITAGQNVNPEISYSTQYFPSFDNIFAGRKLGNSFSIYLYKPKINGFRTEILAKGTLHEEKNKIRIDCSFEIPFGSLMKFLILGFIFNVPFYLSSSTVGLIFSFIIVAIYATIISANHTDIKKTLSTQLKRIEQENIHAKV
ncbi:hypothetical protein ACUNWD_12375 [Sunxiuqinia sp. A32]|uniref:hypothetical protein n=1 Tax=Sunxiuqinia sp. A32 TaxID=3461496 RepID=UPI0040453B73